MNVAVIDVGSNTIRLLVGTRAGGTLSEVARGKRVVGLGRDVEQLGAISAPKLAEAAECVCDFVDDARAVGAALIERFSWVFYIFGLLLLITAGHMLAPEERRHGDDDEGVVLRMTRALMPDSCSYDGDRFFTVKDGRRVITPMLLVVLALGLTDILFALDSIPAIFAIAYASLVGSRCPVSNVSSRIGCGARRG